MNDEVDTLTIKGDEIKHEYKHKHKHEHEHKHKERKMEEHVNVFAGGRGMGGYGCNDGFGLGGGGLLGGLLFGSLLSGRGLGFGGYGGGYGDTSGVQLVDTAVDIETLTKLGDIQGQIGNSALQIQNGLLEQTIANQQSFAGVSAGICAVNGSVKDAAYAVSSAISNDGDKTRALISGYHLADLERQLAVAQNALNDNAHELRRQNDRREIEITMINNQNQTNLQVAQQNAALGQIAHCLAGVAQDARVTSVAVNNGGLQVANPNNTANNTKV
jgi:hypothetical protein